MAPFFSYLEIKCDKRWLGVNRAGMLFYGLLFRKSVNLITFLQGLI